MAATTYQELLLTSRKTIIEKFNFPFYLGQVFWNKAFLENAAKTLMAVADLKSWE